MCDSRIDDVTTLRRALNVLPHPLLLHDGVTVLFANPAALDLLQAEHASQVIGRSPAEFVHPDCIPAMRERMEFMLSSGADTTVIEKLVTATGETFHAQMNGYVLGDSERPLMMVIGRELAP